MPSACAGEEAAGNDSAPACASPEDVWRGYDPESLPLDLEVLRTWSEEGVACEKLRFTGEIAGGKPTRVLALRGMPEGKREPGAAGQAGIPGILHIHGGGQTLSLAWVKYWAQRGYACVSHDFCGAAYDRTEFTEWGPLEHCNMMKAGDGHTSRPDPRDSSWYHWVVAARRALTVLSRTSGVDAQKLGIFGVSVGGTLSWMVAGCDPRVKVAVPLYGCGYNIDNRRSPVDAAPPSEAQWAFKRVLAPEAWAPYMDCPVLFLSATNDMHGRLPTAYEILGALKAESRLAITPRYDHHVGPEEAQGLPLWMEWHLRSGPAWPKAPLLEIRLDEGGSPEGTVTADRSGEVRRVDVHYSLDDKVPGARFWRAARVDRTPGGWRAFLPVADVWKSLHAFANVYYTSGVCLSSNLAQVTPGQLGRARATLLWSPRLDDDAGGIQTWYFVPAYVDPNVSWEYLLSGGDESSGRHLALNPEPFGADVDFHIGTHAIGDEDHEGRAGLAFAFEFRGGFKSEPIVRVIYNDRLMTSKAFEARLPIPTSGSIWQAAHLELPAFKAQDGRCPETWKGAQKLEIKGVASRGEPPCFRGFRWAKSPESPSEPQ